MLALEAGRLDAVQHKSPRLYARWAAEAKLDHSTIERDLKSIITGNGLNPFMPTMRWHLICTGIG